MQEFTPQIDAAFREYAEKQFRRHVLLAEDKGNSSEEADEVEQRLLALWEGFDDTQRRCLNGMASDLNWLRRRGAPPPKGRSASDVTDVEMSQLQAAQDNNDWYASLHYLRVCAPRLPQDLLAYLRATCYYALGYPQISAALTDLTVELSRGNSKIGQMAFEVLVSLTPGMAFRRAIEIFSSASEYPPVIVAKSIGYVFDSLGGDPALFDVNKLVGILQEALCRLETTQNSIEDRLLFCELAGAEMQEMGQEKQARELYEQGLRLQPENPALLSRLGTLLYRTEKLQALELFKKAIQSKTRVIAPYIALAHEFLAQREFAFALEYAQEALDLATNDRARAVVLEIMAICESELGSAGDRVLQMFSEAARLAPGSARFAANLKAFVSLRESNVAKADYDYSEDNADYGWRQRIVKTTDQTTAFAGTPTGQFFK